MNTEKNKFIDNLSIDLNRKKARDDGQQRKGCFYNTP